jgi:capsular polysaccharide transport system permease protein
MTAPAGIIKLEVRAFTPRDAREIADAVVQKCEELVNGLNDKMRRDTISVAESELRKSGERLKNIRVRLETLRNEQGVIDTSETSSSFTKLLVDLEGELLKAKNDYETGKKYVNDTAPQLKVLKAKMDTLTSQIAEVKSKVTTNNNLFPNMDSKATGESVLSSKMRQFSEIELQQKIAEASYTQSSAALEMARQMSEKKMIYLHQITEPTLPEEAKYPSRKLYIALFLAASTIAYLIINRLANFVRDHFA